MSDGIDFDKVREIVRIAEESDLAELEVEHAGLRVRVCRAASRAAGVVQPAEPAVTPASGDAPAAGAAASEPPEDHLVPIVAPMVGTFYRAPSPDAAPFVQVGDLVEAGQVVCVIEAMKLFNEIQADQRGRVARILVENASPVEYGQPLLLLDPTAARG
jgi:acetyl-CoA carboxylase biotin carboxyl carrier protein